MCGRSSPTFTHPGMGPGWGANTAPSPSCRPLRSPRPPSPCSPLWGAHTPLTSGWGRASGLAGAGCLGKPGVFSRRLCQALGAACLSLTLCHSQVKEESVGVPWTHGHGLGTRYVSGMRAEGTCSFWNFWTHTVSLCRALRPLLLCTPGQDSLWT